MKRRSLLGSTSILALSAGCLFDGRLDGDDDEHLSATGTIEVSIDGDPVDLTADRFQAEHADEHSRAFHLHEGDERWFMEGEERVTVAEAIDLLPHFEYARQDGAHVVTVDGTTYDGTAADITVRVNGDDVDPTEYELHDGDHLRVAIDTGAERL